MAKKLKVEIVGEEEYGVFEGHTTMKVTLKRGKETKVIEDCVSYDTDEESLEAMWYDN